MAKRKLTPEEIRALAKSKQPGHKTPRGMKDRGKMRLKKRDKK